MKKELIAHREPKSPVSETFRTLRTNIQFMNTNKKLQTLLVTSTLPGEGKSWVSSNLAVTFAQAGKKVVLIDADMRKGRQYVIFGASPRPGLSNYLSGVDPNADEAVEKDLVNYIQETEVENLFLIAAGNIPPNPSELLISPQMVKLLEELKELCDIIIIDGTPSALVTDSIILSRLVDSTIIVTAHKETKKDNLGHIIKNIENVGGKIAGVVINKMPISAKKYEQTYYYGSTTSKNKNSSRVHRETSKRVSSNFLQSGVKEKVNINKKVDETISLPASKINESKIINNIEKNEMNNAETNSNENDSISIEKTNDILKQINEYLDKEKSKLNKGE